MFVCLNAEIKILMYEIHILFNLFILTYIRWVFRRVLNKRMLLFGDCKVGLPCRMIIMDLYIYIYISILWIM